MSLTIDALASGQLAAWFARRPSFALMGEYSAGKSALLNALLGQSLLPTRVTATDLPAVWITHGDRTFSSTRRALPFWANWRRAVSVCFNDANTCLLYTSPSPRD